MAIIPSTKYSGQTTTGDPGYPDGKAKNVTVSGDGTGTPLEADWVNDLWGFLQALLDRAGITASGSPDEVGTSDYLDSLSQWIGVEDDLYQRGYSVRTAELFQEDTFRVIADGWTNIKSMAMSNDGVYMYLGDDGGAGDANIVQYTLSTPHDVRTVTETDTLNVNAYETIPGGLYLKTGGGSLFMSGTSDEVRRIDMSTPYDLTTASITTDFYDYSAQATTGTGLVFSSTGDRFFIHDITGKRLLEYSTGSAWVVVGSSYIGAFDTSTEMPSGESLTSLRFGHPQGRRLFGAEYDASNCYIHEYDLEVAYRISGNAGSFREGSRNFTGWSADKKLHGLAFSGDGRYMHLAREDGVIQTFHTGVMR